MSGNARDAGRSTVDRLLTVLEVFDGCDLSLNEIAARSGLPLTTTHRMLNALEGWGGVERNAAGRYLVGTRLWELGMRASMPQVLREASLPLMQDLYEATHENVQLAIIDNGQALVIERLNGRRSVPTRTEVGGRLPLHATGVGKVLLAHADPRLLHDVVGHGLHRYTPYTLVMPGRLAAALAAMRDTGLGYSLEEMTIGAASVAAPVTDATGRVVAALALVVHSQIQVSRYAAAVRTAALGISRRVSEIDDFTHFRPAVVDGSGSGPHSATMGPMRLVGRDSNGQEMTGDRDRTEPRPHQNAASRAG